MGNGYQCTNLANSKEKHAFRPTKKIISLVLFNVKSTFEIKFCLQLKLSR